MTLLVSERVGQLFVDGDRIEYTEYGAGDRWVVLLHGELMPRRMHEPLARLLAGAGFHVVAPDLLGHGRSDRPLDPKGYSMTAFGEQVVALLDHLGVDQAAIHGILFGRIAPSSKRRRRIEAPALVIGHPRDPVHPAADAAMLAQEMPHARFVPARSIVEWRARPGRLNDEAVDFATECWARPSPRSDVG